MYVIFLSLLHINYLEFSNKLFVISNIGVIFFHAKKLYTKHSVNKYRFWVHGGNKLAIYNKNTMKLALAGFAALQLSLVQPAHANIDRNGKRVDIVVDNQFFNDNEVMEALEKYTNVIEDKYGITVNTYSFEKSAISGNSRNSLDKARQLKDQLRGSYNSQWNGKLEGVIFVGSLPKAYMESWNGGSYESSQTEFYFMDLNGNWEDHYQNNCRTINGEEVCSKVGGGNGILESHSDNNNAAPFEIWISRVDPYTALNFSEASYDKAKAKLLNWLDKAYNNQVKNERTQKSLMIWYSNTVYHPTPDFIEIQNGLDAMYPALGYETASLSDVSGYLNSIQKDCDWITYFGTSAVSYGDPMVVGSLPSSAFYYGNTDVKARVIHFTSDKAAQSYDAAGNLTGSAIAPAHVFNTLGGGVAAIAPAGSTDKTRSHDRFMMDATAGNFLGEAFLSWVNQQVQSNSYANSSDIFKYFYSESFIGDPFVVIGEDDKYIVADPSEKVNFMTFDDPENPWTSTNSELAYDADVKVGSEGYSLSILNGSNGTNKTIKSPKFANTDIVSEKYILLDVFVPADQYWYGNVELKLDIPSAGIYSMWLGNADLGNKGGDWVTVKFQVNDQAMTALKKKFKDGQFVIGLNTNNTVTPYRIDNMRFAPAEQPKFQNASYGALVRGTSNASAIRVDGRSVSQSNATSSMTIQKK